MKKAIAITTLMSGTAASTPAAQAANASMKTKFEQGPPSRLRRLLVA